MNIYLISQTENLGYDKYDSAVVVAESEEQAKSIHPSGRLFDPDAEDYLRWDYTFSSWASNPENVKATWIGTAGSHLNAGHVVCASFNAG